MYTLIARNEHILHNGLNMFLFTRIVSLHPPICQTTDPERVIGRGSVEQNRPFVSDKDNTVDILGIPVHCGEPSEVRALIDKRIIQRLPTRIAFLNAHLSNIAARDRDLQEQLQSFLVLNDGIGIDLARRILHGRPFERNLNGTDFLPYLLETTEHNLRVFLLGARKHVVTEAAAVISTRWPRHRIVGLRDGYFDKRNEPDIQNEIRRADPDLVLVGMGNPRQEAWIASNIPSVCSCALAIGAGFDFLSGTIPRAPGWIRRMRLEWLYRLCREPVRLGRRYLVGNIVFLVRVALERFRTQHNKGLLRQ